MSRTKRFGTARYKISCDRPQVHQFAFAPKLPAGRCPLTKSILINLGNKPIDIESLRLPLDAYFNRRQRLTRYG
jgi:hypothetical protein